MPAKKKTAVQSKRKRGRPKKVIQPTFLEVTTQGSFQQTRFDPNTIKKRKRRKKNPDATGSQTKLNESVREIPPQQDKEPVTLTTDFAFVFVHLLVVVVVSFFLLLPIAEI